MVQDRQDSPHTLSELVGGLSSDVQDLVRGEIALARAEFGQKLQRVLLAETWHLGGVADCRRGCDLYWRLTCQIRPRDAVTRSTLSCPHRSEPAERRAINQAAYMMSDNTIGCEVFGAAGRNRTAG